MNEGNKKTDDIDDIVGLICTKCNAPLILKKVTFEYINHTFYSDVPTCPKCGQVFLSEETVNNKVKEIEKLLEDK